MTELIDFDLVESQKENIAPLRSGHSASALARSFQKAPMDSKTELDARRAEFEKQIAESAELDDPIQPYLDYIKYINELYPQGHTAENGLVHVLERCTSQFRDAPYYKDDARYLRVWIQYAKYSDAPKELYTYLARKEIGRNLSLFYEEYAAYLETADRKNQAKQVYLTGIDANARPVERLRRRYQEFCDRVAASPASENEPTSPVFAPVRAVLSVKGTTGSELSTAVGSVTRNVSVFNDPTPNSEALPLNSGSGWDMFGTLGQRRKENVMEAKSWDGEKIQLNPDYAKKPVKSMSIFRDPATSTAHPPTAPGAREEKMAVAIQFLHDEHGEEYCLEEVLARSRHILNKSYPRPFPQQKDIGDEVYSEPLKVPASPTMTFHTKAATEEIYEMFNQPLPDEDDHSDSDFDTDASKDSSDESVNDYSDDDQLRSGMDELTYNTGQLSVNHAQTSQPSDLKAPFAPAKELSARRHPAMTPITEGREPLYSVQGMRSPATAQGDIFNPMDFSLRQKLIKSPANRTFIENQPNFFSYGKKFGMEQKLRRAVQARRNSGSSGVQVTFPGNGRTLNFLKIVGEGGFGSVFLVQTENGELKACKVERSQLAWEYYVFKKVQERLQNSRTLKSMMIIDEVHSFEDEQYLLQEFLPYGTLLDAVNYWKEEHGGKPFDEITAMFFAVEVLRSMEGLHSHNIIHGDIKPDNFMIRFDGKNLDSRHYASSGADGWESRGVKIIDLGRGIDMKLFSSQVKFTADWKMDQQDCVEMQKGQPWTFQADYHGAAAIVYLMLFGEFIKVVEDREGDMSVYRIANSLKRYWQKDMWNELFTILLNSALVAKQSGVSLPLTPLLSNCREKFEAYLEQQSEGNGTSLYNSLQWLQERLEKRQSRIL